MSMKRGPAPKGKVILTWSPSFAYAIGLIAADGCLSKDRRHISFVSKDLEQINSFQACLGITTKISQKRSGSGSPAYFTQFGDVLFFDFLVSIGLTPAKSKTMGPIGVPEAFFRDFLRGYFDGDGSSYSYQDPAFPRSFRFYLSFTSASPSFITWFRGRMTQFLGVTGYISRNKNNEHLQLKYSKREAVLICENMYYTEGLPYLDRKAEKIKGALGIIMKSRSGEIGRRAVFRTQ